MKITLRPPGPAGFTLPELLVVMLITAILLTIAMPRLSDSLQDARLSSDANTFLHSVMTARSEAVKRGSVVSVCPTLDGASCDATGDWSNGWIVYSDEGAQGTVDDSDEILLLVDNLTDNLSVLSDPQASGLSFSSTGESSAAGDFVLCDGRGDSRAKAVCLKLTGMAYVSDKTCAQAQLSCAS